MPSRPRKSAPFVPASQVLDKLLKRHGIEIRQNAWEVEQKWTEIVGEKIASHAAVKEIRHRKLVVAVDSASWVQQLTLLKDALLSRIHARFGEPLIRDVVFRVAPLPPSRVKRKEVSPPKRPLTESERVAVSENLRGIRDPELCKILERLMTLDAGTRPENRP